MIYLNTRSSSFSESVTAALVVVGFLALFFYLMCDDSPTLDIGWLRTIIIS